MGGVEREGGGGGLMLIVASGKPARIHGIRSFAR